MSADFIVVADGADAARGVLEVLPPALAARARQLPFQDADDPLSEQAVVLLDSSQASRDLAGRLAAAGACVTWAVEAVTPHDDGGFEVRRIVDGGEGRLIEHLPGHGQLVVLTRTGAESGGHSAVVAVGRGIGSSDHVELFERLASALGAKLGATRWVVDQGWLPFSHQIGQTGAMVAPSLYVGFGVSGAVQHVVGMRDSATVVAVNTDRDAPLCQLADLVIEADAVEVASALLARVEEERSQ